MDKRNKKLCLLGLDLLSVFSREGITDSEFFEYAIKRLSQARSSLLIMR